MITEKEYLDLKVIMLQERIMRLEAQSFIGQQQYDAAKIELEELTKKMEKDKEQSTSKE
jgi:hypothetical protein